MARSEDGGKRRDGQDHYRCAALLQPLRNRTLRLISELGQADLDKLTAELGHPPARIAYHVRVLYRRGALQMIPRRRPKPPLYRLSPDAAWVREMLDEADGQAPRGA